MLNYTCPICGNREFRDNSRCFKGIINNKEYFIFQHECYHNNCEGILYIARDFNIKNEERFIVGVNDITKIIDK